MRAKTGYSGLLSQTVELYIEMVSDDEKYHALQILMKHYRGEDFPFNKAVMPVTKVFKLVVENMTGKIRVKRQAEK